MGFNDVPRNRRMTRAFTDEPLNPHDPPGRQEIRRRPLEEIARRGTWSRRPVGDVS